MATPPDPLANHSQDVKERCPDSRPAAARVWPSNSVRKYWLATRCGRCARRAACVADKGGQGDWDTRFDARILVRAYRNMGPGNRSPIRG